MSDAKQIVTHEQASVKMNSWVQEYWPQTFGHEYDPADGWESLRFGICAMDALGQSAGVHPEIMEGAFIDQVDDLAIYYGLKRAAQFRRELYCDDSYRDQHIIEATAIEIPHLSSQNL